jgi:hypothetical protein
VLALAAVVLIPVELMSFAAGSLLARRSLLYDPPRVDDYAAYLAKRDPLLGWSAPVNDTKRSEVDRAGSRLIPRFPDPATRSCVALFGDSFTWGDEVASDAAPSNVLSELLGCRVANYGVPGYGTDQAYLRYSLAVKDDAPVVVLGYFSENIVRNVGQNRGFRTNDGLSLKPRFVLEGGELRLIPLPDLTYSEYLDLRSRAQELLPHEYFAPGGPSGLRSLRFPFTLSVIGAIGDDRILARLAGRPSYAAFYSPDHPSRALQVTEAIIQAFAREARRRGQKFLVVMIPDAKDVAWYRSHGSAPYAEITRRLAAGGVNVEDLADEFNTYLATRAVCEIYTRCDAGHFNKEGYRRLAEFIFARLRHNGWVGAP